MFLALKVLQTLFCFPPSPIHPLCTLCSLILSCPPHSPSDFPTLSSCSSSFCSSGTVSQGESWIINLHKALNCHSISVHAVSTYADYPSISRDPERANEVYAINIPWKEGKFPSEALNDSTAPQLSAPSGPHGTSRVCTIFQLAQVLHPSERPRDSCSLCWNRAAWKEPSQTASIMPRREKNNQGDNSLHWLLRFSGRTPWLRTEHDWLCCFQHFLPFRNILLISNPPYAQNRRYQSSSPLKAKCLMPALEKLSSPPCFIFPGFLLFSFHPPFLVNLTCP